MTHDMPPDAPPPATAAAGPDHRDLYLIVIGVLLGVLLGPGVLGRFAPNWHDRFVLAGENSLRHQLVQFERETGEKLQTLAATGVSPEALSETLDRRTAARDGLRDQLDVARATVRGRLLALVIGVLLVMVIETLVDAHAEKGRRTRQRLATARYALIAIWVALVLAQPGVLKEMPLTFLVGLIVVALAVALVPLQKSRKFEKQESGK